MTILGQLADFASVNAVCLARLLKMLDPVFVPCSRRRACDNAFAPHG